MRRHVQVRPFLRIIPGYSGSGRNTSTAQERRYKDNQNRTFLRQKRWYVSYKNWRDGQRVFRLGCIRLEERERSVEEPFVQGRTRRRKRPRLPWNLLA